MDDATFAEPEAFYDEYGEREWDRLGERLEGRLEFEGTTAALEEYLPSSGRVLDAGGGAGRYAVWLAERGYDVALADLSRGQLSVAREKVAERGLEARVTLSRQSITDLALRTDAFDATLCLGGPLSHVLDADDRARAARELRRVTAPGGPVFASAMGRLGALQLFLTTRHNLRALPELLETGDYDAALLDEYGYDDEFTETHFFRLEEFETLLADAGIDVETVRGLEGLASMVRAGGSVESGDLDEGERAALDAVVAATNDDRAVAALSTHFLAVGRA